MKNGMLEHISSQLEDIRQQGLFKAERTIDSPQNPSIQMADGEAVLNLCANNYLGLADHPEIVKAAHEGLDRWGYGMASVRFICGTQSVHRQLETAISEFIGMDDTILYSSCFDANGGLFETLLSAEDAIISDQLNHASIIDGVRLCKAQRFRYRNNDMADLEQQLKDAQSARFRLIATDGVFSMDGYLAKPFTGRSLIETVSTHLAYKRTEGFIPAAEMLLEFSLKWDDLIESCNNDSTQVRELIQIVERTVPLQFSDIHGAIAERDLERLGRSLHRLKGCLGNICVGDVIERLAKFEDIVKHPFGVERIAFQIVVIERTVKSLIQCMTKKLQ